MIQWDLNAVGSTVAEFININTYAPGYLNTYAPWSGLASAGYNIINFSPPLFYPKGTVLLITAPYAARVAINTAYYTTYQDFAWGEALLVDAGMNVLAKVLTQSTSSGQTTRTNTFTHTYASPGEFYLSTKFQCDTLTYDDIQIVNGELHLKRMMELV